MVTSAELAAAGISATDVQRLVRRRVLLPMGRGVYARPHLVAAATGKMGGEHALRVVVAVAASGHEAAASHHDAAVIHGLDLLDRRPPDVVSVTRPPGTTGSRTGRPGILLHASALPDAHLMIRHGIRVTSVARTVIDLARVSTFQEGVVVADSALHTRQTSKAELRSVLTTCSHWRGSRQAGQVVEFCDARSESVLESISRVAFRDYGLPQPDL